MNMKGIVLACALGLLASSGALAQTVERGVGVVSEDIASQLQAFSYREGPESKLLFRGTAIALAADGKGEVEFQDGRARVEVSVRKMPGPWQLGPYTTYVLWAVSADGRAFNLGSIDLSGDRGKLKASTALSQFALIISAEPHFAVTAPGKAVVMVNLARYIKGETIMISGLSERMDYANLDKLPVDLRGREPLDLVQARYAVNIAQAAGAAEYAPAAFSKASELLAAAESAQASKKYRDRKPVPRLSREAVQAAEDARRSAVEASAIAEADARKNAAARAAREAAEEKARQAAELASEEARRRAEQAKLVAAEAARQAAARAASGEIAKARADFTARLNRALPTRETDRGVVAEISGVQFAIDAATLNSEAREALARFSGIVGTYPELRFLIEGHTDITGSYARNMTLSMERAISVRDYLVGQGVANSSIEVAGLGPDRPVADNETTEGRARNRRVEIVLTGGPVGFN